MKFLDRWLGSPEDRPTITDGELFALILFNLVTTIGLAGDIARHLQRPEELNNGNDFLSGWHLILYGGVAGVGLWLGVGAIRRGPAFIRSGSFTTLGFLSLSAGGGLDAAWHGKFGTEKAVEALVSPPHLVVFAGLLFLLTGPIVILWARQPVRLGWVQSVAVMVSSVSAVLVTSLFTGFLSPFSGGMSLQPGYQEPLVGESLSDYDQVRGLGIVVWTIVVLVVGFVVPLCRFRLRPGLIAIGFALLVVPAHILSGEEVRPLIIGFLVAGVVVELSVAAMGRPVLGRVGATATAALLGVSLWAVTFGVLQADKLPSYATTPVIGAPATDIPVSSVPFGGGDGDQVIDIGPTFTPVGQFGQIGDRLSWGPALFGGAIVLAGMVGAAVAALATLVVRKPAAAEAPGAPSGPVAGRLPQDEPPASTDVPLDDDALFVNPDAPTVAEVAP